MIHNLKEKKELSFFVVLIAYIVVNSFCSYMRQRRTEALLKASLVKQDSLLYICNQNKYKYDDLQKPADTTLVQ